MKISLYRSRALFIIIFIGLNLSLLGQDKLQIVMGTVRNSSNYEPVSFAIVKNEMLHTKIVSDEKGQYIIPVNKGDLIKVTAIGFEDGFYIINDTSGLISNFPIQLKPRIYELKEFTLTPYRTVLQFKHAVAQLVLPEENLVPDLHLLNKIQPINEAIPGELGPIVFQGPISALYNTFSHKGKMVKKYQKLVSKDYKNNAVRKRFKQIFIAEIIPIESEDELDAFIKFCQFDINSLLNTSDYELIAIVQRKYAEYINTQSSLIKQKHI